MLHVAGVWWWGRGEPRPFLIWDSQKIVHIHVTVSRSVVVHTHTFSLYLLQVSGSSTGIAHTRPRGGNCVCVRWYLPRRTYAQPIKIDVIRAHTHNGNNNDDDDAFKRDGRKRADGERERERAISHRQQQQQQQPEQQQQKARCRRKKKTETAFLGFSYLLVHYVHCKHRSKYGFCGRRGPIWERSKSKR